MSTADSFKSWMQAQGWNPNTIKAYHHSARLFEKGIGKSSVKHAKNEDVVQFLNRFNPESKPRHFAALRVLLKYVKNAKIVEDMSVTGQSKPLEKWYSKQEVQKLLDPPKIEDDFYHQLDRGIVRVGYDLALRRGEVARLNLADIHENYATIHVEKKRTRLNAYRMTLYPMTTATLNEYVTVLKALESDRVLTDGPLFVNEFTLNRISPDAIDFRFFQLCRRVGIEMTGFHNLRHARAAHMREAGVPLETIKEFLHHSDLRTTLKYAHIGPHIVEKEVPVPDV